MDIWKLINSILKSKSQNIPPTKAVVTLQLNRFTRSYQVSEPDMNG